jgi:nucleotide-binding universal stress UspA family protein
LTESGKLTVHVVEALSAARSILEFAANNRVSHILIGARQSSLKRALLGSVSAEVASEATCTVSVVRPQGGGEASGSA